MCIGKMTPTLSLSENLPSWKEALKVRVICLAKEWDAVFINVVEIP